MIPEEVAQIASMLRNAYPYPTEDEFDAEKEFDYSVKIAWEIYNKLRENQELMQDACERHG